MRGLPRPGAGGAWTAAHRGVSFDAYRAEGSNRRADAFLEAQHLPKSARFDVSVYTQAGAALLARTWCEKCQHLYDIAAAHGDERHEFSDAELAMWLEPSAFADLTEHATGRALQRCLWLRALRPCPREL